MRRPLKASVFVPELTAGLSAHIHEDLCLTTIFEQFGFYYQAPASQDLVFGHFIDALSQMDLEHVDPLDVAEIAADLGYEEAQVFLDQAQSILEPLYSRCG